MTYLTVPIAAKDLEQAVTQIKAAAAGRAEMLELRTDYLENLSTELVRKLIVEAKGICGSVPLIVTCRDVRQGGVIDYPLTLRIDVLAEALKAGAEYVDFEYDNFLAPTSRGKIRVAKSQSLKGKLILSAHNFSGRLPDMSKLYRHIQTLYPAAIPKLVYTANHINDCFDAFDLLHKTSGERIIFCMGQAGLISRIIAKKLGSFVTFASLDDDTATAPGQLTIGQFKNLYRYNDIKPDTELYGVIGSPIAHSLSPAIHNACFVDAGMNKLYLPLLVEGGKEEFEQFMKNAVNRPWLNFHGLSITIPHKANVLDYTRKMYGFIEPLADRIGAANTLLLSRNGKFKAYNTDYSGALDAITSAMKINRADLKEISVAVIGAGGVARAIVAGLSDAGAKIKIYNRTIEKAQSLAAEFHCEAGPLEDLQNMDAKLLVNCTSIGMHPEVEKSPLRKST